MPDLAANYNPATYALWRNVQNLSYRTRLGGIYYLFAWLLVWLCSDSPMQHWFTGVTGCLLFGSLTVLRWRHHIPDQSNTIALQSWTSRQWVLLFSTAALWGLANAFVLRSSAFQSVLPVAFISTIAFSTAFAFSPATQLSRSIVVIMLLNLPGLIVLIDDWHQQKPALFTLLIYQCYLLLACFRSHREYDASIALEQELLEQRNMLERLSRTDSLTQLGNRYQFNSLFPAMVASAQRQQSPLSLVLLDIDFFKRINDELGHTAGDACLEAFAERMRHTFRRDSDALLRLGGEEFGVLMPNTSIEQASQLAEQFRNDLNSRSLDIQGQHKLLTTSIGVGCFDGERDSSAEAFFKRVDDALYRAKDQGRDRLMTA